MAELLKVLELKSFLRGNACLKARLEVATELEGQLPDPAKNRCHWVECCVPELVTCENPKQDPLLRTHFVTIEHGILLVSGANA